MRKKGSKNKQKRAKALDTTTNVASQVEEVNKESKEETN